MKVPFVIYADLESLFEKMSTCYNNPKKSSTSKINRHTPSGYLLFKHCSFDTTKNKLDYYRGKNCIIEQKYILRKLIIIEAKKICLDLKKHVTKITNHEKKELMPLTNEKKYIVNKKCVIYVKKDLVLIITIKNTIK